MPIYAYRCESCGHAQDVLQKLSDAPLQTCPACGAASFRKQVTAAGFQLKGSGWYATDFKNNNNGAKPAPAPAAADAGAADAKPGAPAQESGAAAPKPESGGSSGSTGGSSPDSAAGPAVSAAGGCGAGCACH